MGIDPVKLHEWPVLLVSLLAACGSTRDSRDNDKGPILVYPISANAADTILKDAMRAEFDEDRIERLTAPHMGYKATVYFALDRHTVRVYRIQAQAKRRDGSTVPGFYFEVKNIGTIIEGVNRSDRIYTRILAAAKREAGGLPIADTQEQ